LTPRQLAKTDRQRIATWFVFGLNCTLCRAGEIGEMRRAAVAASSQDPMELVTRNYRLITCTVLWLRVDPHPMQGRRDRRNRKRKARSLMTRLQRIWCPIQYRTVATFGMIQSRKSLGAAGGTVLFGLRQLAGYRSRVAGGLRTCAAATS
jgi:hypothetical protein